MKVRKTTEDYLKTIYVLSKKKNVHACMLADELCVSRPTVSSMIKRLQCEGYVAVDCRNVITLTQSGYETALYTYERHKILEDFLTGLGVNEETAHRDACEMEHGLGSESYNAIKRLVEQSNAQENGSADRR